MVGGLIGIAMPYYQKLALEAKEVTLKTGLVNIRSGIVLYQALQRHYPTDLKSLVREKYILPVNDKIISREYLIAQSVDTEGNLLDPFGNHYRYDPVTGQVASSTEGYESW
ncbi:hypothetical protein [Candidatus Manganitrophus noduliformans]|uniref:Type II secretion system protein GspG C-terminal domain-containing protein n=1 Tax=Candidatus Manganitrophus noduliformans TaxID=2606439 RepID=A0A7X6DST1_9BACT|nr:hypothetical protein [Candidatus Manganitrophus noduliformans]NKE72722.1 hypothetical protein [Candidatus Manganitrophus noduliformans]